MSAMAQRAPAGRRFGARLLDRADRRSVQVLLLPTLVVVAIVDGLPLVYSLVVSLQNRSLDNPHTAFVGLRNYASLFQDDQTWQSIGLSLTFTAGSVALSFVVGLGGALLLNPPLRGRGIIRALFIIPWAVPAFVAALTWSWIYNDQFGILDALLKDFGVAHPPVWLDANHAMISLVIVMFWKSFPFQLIMLLAGLQAIPLDLYEAARVDGAGFLRQFWHITMPLLRPVAMISTLLAVINAFQYFPIPWVLTQGGPANATNVIPISSYNFAFQAGDVSLGATVAVIMFLVILVGALGYLWLYVKKVGRL
ncbi:carbohydrate ABC transporter permease [Actinomadura nitritigenes]|uniref:carbohydrate ABC transporter permease n=1 Tax=Actinomadura nitritigenes TaxID=134602 RepID=UPI003D935811